MLLLFLLTVTTITASPTYYTIWLNNGNKIVPFLDQLGQQNRNFNDLLIVDSNVRPFVTSHSRVLLDKSIFQQAIASHPTLSQKLARLEAVYDIIKPTNPAAASDILRFVAVFGLEGDEFIYHDVDVKIRSGLTELSQPISFAMIGSQPRAHLSKNWVLRAIKYPSRDMSLIGANINNDLIGIIKSKSIDLLTEYMEKVCNYYDNSLNKVFISNTNRRTTFQEIITTPSDETFRLENIDEYVDIIGSSSGSPEIRDKFVSGLSRRELQFKFAFSASISQFENILQRVFNAEYYTPHPPIDEDDPYAMAERQFKLHNLVLRGEPRGVTNFVRDYIADPVTFGATSRADTVDWLGTSTANAQDVLTLDAEPLDDEAPATYDSEEDLTDYEEYDEDADVRELDVGAINIDSTHMFCGNRRRRSVGILCARNDPDKYTLSDDTIMFDGKDVTFISRFVYVSNDKNRYKYNAITAVKNKLINLKQQITARIEKALRLPSGKQAMYDLRNQYIRLNGPDQLTKKYNLIHGISSPLVRKFNRMRFAVGYTTAIAFGTQFLAQAISSDLDIAHKIALGTIGSVGIAEVGYVSATKLAKLFGKTLPASIAAKVGGAFKVLNVATAVYFIVDSSIVLSKNPHDLEAWYWLSRGVTMFTPLNKLFVPIDISLIITKQIVSANWELAHGQNNVLLTRAERTHFHAMRFFGVNTQWTSNVQNGGMFKSNIVNPSVNKLRGLLTDAYGVVGYPVTTICKSTERIIYNIFNDYYTDLKSTRMISLAVVRNSLSATRMQLCLRDYESQCIPQEHTGFDWFVSSYAQAARVRYRGVDFGVGCILLDGTTLTGNACTQIDRMKQDIKDREKIFVVLEGSEEYVLPFVNPEDYNFNFISVTNGSILEVATADCQTTLKWNKPISPYILVNPTKHSGRIDYIGVPTSIENTVMTTIDGYPSRVYVYKPNKNNKSDNITVIVSDSYENEYILMEIEDYWTLRGKNNLIINPTNVSVLIGNDSTIINNMVNVESPSSIILSNSVVEIEENQTAPILYLTNCSVDANQYSHSLIIGNNNTISVKKYAIANLYMYGGITTITADAFVNIVLNASDLTSQAIIRSNPLSKFVIIGLSETWTINRTNNDSIVIDNRIKVLQGTIILLFQNYYIITSADYEKDTIIFLSDTITDTSVLNKLVNPIILSMKAGVLSEHIQGNFTVPPYTYSFVIYGDTNINIPYSTSKQLNFYGSSNITIANNMIDCGVPDTCGIPESCTLYAHLNCTDAIKVCIME